MLFRSDGSPLQPCVPPLQMRERIKVVAFDRLDLGRLEQRLAFRAKLHRAEGAVALVPPGAPRDLRHFGNRQAAVPLAVELGQAGEGDVRHVKVERSEEHTSELQSLMRISYAV